MTGTTEHTWRLSGDRGAIVLSNATANPVRGFQLCLHRDGKAIELTTPEPELLPGTDPRVDALESILRRFVAAVGAGCPAEPSVASGLRVQRLLDTIAASAARQREPS
jgi:predicted dehydrogenase